jgi:pimeloyl-ACP methyl ester carboxylesterase
VRTTSELRAEEIRAVIAAAQLVDRPFVIGHSFGGFMTMKVASQYGDMLGGAVIVDSPIGSPEEEARHPLSQLRTQFPRSGRGGAVSSGEV